jgi:hypothetical protein
MLYVRHQAWLSAVPEKARDAISKDPNVSRMQKMRDDLGDDEFNPEMPPVSAPYLIDYLFELGPTMGENTLTHAELESWQRNTGIELSSWESRTLKALSNAYLIESYRAVKEDAEAPWSDAPYVKPSAGVLLGRIKAAFTF